ncbi:MAG: LCP family protein, partial [Anaerolinea sp.]|nr:LCP family protein [Anaerolinea sp.]
MQEQVIVSRAAARERLRQRRLRSRRRGGEWAWVIIAGALFSIVIILSISVALIFRTAQTGVRVLPTAVGALPTPVDARQIYTGGELRAGQQLVLDDGRSIVLQPWNGTSRFTLLVMGLDRRPNERGLAYRTDTMMLISLDPQTNSLGILSIPRDLYVEVPGYGSLQRINSAMVLGELQQPGYGPSLAMQTVQYNFGMRVHDYVALDFNGAIRIIDLLGGLEINVPYDIIDYEYPDMNYGYDPLILRAGLQWMDGATALKFARTRHGDSDFERARRQQMVLYALRDRILNLNMLPQLIIQSPSLLNALQNSVYTGMSLDQMIQLALYLKDISNENIRTGVIDGNYI